MKKGFIIAIDGPVAAGKSTIAPLLAKRLNGFYLWTGAMYRCLSLYCAEHSIDFTDETEVSKAAEVIAPTIVFHDGAVFLQGIDVSEKLATQEVASASSMVGIFPDARAAMVKRQQAIAKEKTHDGVVVAEGRDTGTKEFPDAALKIFLTANPEVRAKRRLLQLERKGETVAFESVLHDIIKRDKRDSERETDPLVTEPEKYGYFVVNDSTQTREETIEMIVGELKRRGLFEMKK